MSSPASQPGASASTPDFKFSEEARNFLLAATYGHNMPRATDKSRIPLVLWTLSTSKIGGDGLSVAESGPRYQLFVSPVTDITSEFVVELDAGKPLAFRLDPTLKQAASYSVSLDLGQLRIQPE
jgi:hypothetical protein